MGHDEGCWQLPGAGGRLALASGPMGGVVPAKCLTKWLSRLPGACVGAQSWQDELVSVMHCSSEVMAVSSVACSMLLNLAIF